VLKAIARMFSDFLVRYLAIKLTNEVEQYKELPLLQKEMHGR
jgi:hypothetical protein